jgi:biotin transport system substrate-specific component
MKRSTSRPVFTALFSALICAGAVIAIPVGPVPIVLQNAFAILAGLLLGPLQGAGAVALFLIAGALGFPVFSGGKGGFAVIAGPTGGYLVGYFLGALAAGLIASRASKVNPRQALPLVIAATVTGFACIYIPGILFLRKTLGLGFGEAVAKGIIPFLAGDAIKIAVLVPVAAKLRPVVARYLSPDD